MAEDQSPQATTPFKFAYQGPGLSISVSSSDPNIILQYVGVTFGATLPAAAQPEPSAEQVADAKPTPVKGRQKKDEPKKEAATAAPAAEPAQEPPAKPEPTTPAAPAALTKDRIMELTVDTFGKDRAGVSVVLGKFGVKRFGELADEQLQAYAQALIELRTSLGLEGK